MRSLATHFRALCIGLLVAGSILAASPTVSAQSMARVFTAFDIAVDQVARSTAEARQLAIADAERRAFDILLKKIIPADDLARAAEPDARALRFMIRGLEIANEKSSRTRYLAKITITFDPERVRDYLYRAGLAFSEIAPRPVVLLPVYRYQGADLLWEQDNPWRQAWIDADYRNRLMDYRLAAGSFTDQLEIPVSGAIYGVPASRKRSFVERNKADDVMVVVAEPDVDPHSGHAEVRFGFRRGLAAPFEEGRIQALPGDEPEDMLRRAALAIMERVDIRWRDLTLISAEKEDVLTLILPVDSIDDWVSLRQRLEAIPIIQSMTIDRLALPESAITISYVGGRDRLSLSLAQEGLKLVDDSRGTFLMPMDGSDGPDASGEEGGAG